MPSMHKDMRYKTSSNWGFAEKCMLANLQAPFTHLTYVESDDPPDPTAMRRGGRNSPGGREYLCENAVMRAFDE